MRAHVPILASTVFILTGCVASVDDANPPAPTRDVVPLTETCQQLVPEGGADTLDESRDYAEDLSRIEDFEGTMATSGRARDLVDTLDPIIATAENGIRGDLEAIVAVPRSVIDTEDSGHQSITIPFEGFADAYNSTSSLCYDEVGISSPQSAAPITRNTPVDAYCGHLIKGYEIKSPTIDAKTFGDAWDLMEEGNSCSAHEEENFAFAFESEPDSTGNRIPIDEFNDPVESMWEGFEDAEDAEEKVTAAVDMCLYRPDDPLEDTESPGSIRHYGSSLSLCPEHPHSEQREELLTHLPQAQEEFDQLLDEMAESESR